MTEDQQEEGFDRRGLWRAISRTPQTRTTRGQVADLYGTGPRGGPNTKAAAEDLGVSPRTVQRWMQKGAPERSRTGAPERLSTSHEQWRDSPEGRRSQLGGRREKQLRTQGAQVKYLGAIAISGDPRNRRTRSTTVSLSGEQMSQILDAQLAGDDRAAHAALEDGFADAFGGSLSLSPKRIDL